MLASLRHIIGEPIVTQAGPTKLGAVDAPLLDPAKGTVAAYRVEGREERFLSTTDVAGYTDTAVVTGTPDAVQPVGELIRLKPLITKHAHPFKLKVVDEDGHRLGTADDFEFDTTDHLIARVHVRPPIWKRVFSSHLIIPRERIVSFTKTGITVRYDGSVRSQSAVPAGSKPVS